MIITKNLFLLLFLSLVISFPLLAQKAILNPKEAGMSVERLERFSKFIEKEIAENKIPGAVSMVYRKGHIAHQATHGHSNMQTKTPMQMDQVFYIQSMTKPIVSVAFMMLYEEGHFFLTDKVSKYLPQFKDVKVAKDPTAGPDGGTEPANKEIRISNLLNHTAGFSHGLGPTKLDQAILRALYFAPQKNIESRVNTLVSMPLVGHPGEQWYYSASPDVLALLIEHFSGKSCAEFLEERIFKPLGMKDTGYNLPKEKQARMATLHTYDQAGKLILSPRQTPMEGNTVYGGTHGLFSTISDYMKFGQMLLNKGQFNGHQLLSPKTIELMTVNHVGDLYDTPGNGFGLGFGVLTDLADNKLSGSVGQYYWSGAYNTYFFVDPEEEMVALLMIKSRNFSERLLILIFIVTNCDSSYTKR